MKRLLLLMAIGMIVMIALIGVLTFAQKSSARRALNDYKAQLKAQGEMLSFADLGYPRVVESNDCLSLIVAAVGQIKSARLTPGFIKLMDLTEPTNAQPAWSRSDLPLADKTATNLSWEIVRQELTAAAAPLAEIRAVLQHPPARLVSDPANFSASPQYQFVSQRNAAQWLSAEIIYALRQQNLELAKADLQAQLQLVHLHEEDPTLINQMIRVAIAGLALADTWEALQSSGWSETDLATWQAGWERIMLFRNLEIGLLSERLWGAAMFSYFKNLSASAQVQYINSGYGAFGASLRENLEYYWQVFVTTPLWKMNCEADELLALRHSQNSIESVRRLSHGTNWIVVKHELAGYKATLEKTLDEPYASVRYSLSAWLIVNMEKAAWTVVRNETMRRLAVVAIALKRYELQHQQFPPSLDALVPDFIAQLPLDPMSGQPLGYRTNQTGYVLYSVGEDGVDDGGDSQPSPGVIATDIWSGRDAVWPSVTLKRKSAE